MKSILIRKNLQESYSDIYTSEAMAALSALSGFNSRIKHLMNTRLQRRKERQERKLNITFLDANTLISGTSIKVQEARDGKFDGSAIPADLQRQWIQGTGPAAKPNAPL